MRDARDIVKEAITIALAEGWKPRDYSSLWNDPPPQEKIVAFDCWKYGIKKVTFFTEEAIRFQLPVYEIIFNHAFAQALWGEPRKLTKIEAKAAGYNGYGGLGHGIIDMRQPGWAIRLSEMVLVDDPIKYLGENI